MYGRIGASAAAATAGGAALAGVSYGWWVVGGVTLLVAGFAAGRLIPKRNRRGQP